MMRNYENNYVTSEPALAEKDNKSNVKSTSSGNQIEISDKDSKNNSNVSYTLQHPQESVISQDGNGSTSQRVEIINRLNSSSTSRDVCIKPEAEEVQEELEITNSNFEINESVTQSYSRSRNSHVDSKDDNIQEELSIVKQHVNYDDILKRYEFSKLFINKLYQEKYKHLQKELQKLEEQKEMTLKEKEWEEQIEEKDVGTQQSDIRTNSISETETDSKYNVNTKNRKQWKASNYFEDEIMLLSSDTETDSEQSIFEVPIPPKPQPPVINLQDSDDSDALSNNDDSDKCSFIIEDETKKVSRTSLRNTNPSNDRLIHNITEDIILNCSEVQKGASSITEIKEMNKNVQKKSGDCHNTNKNDSEKNKSASMSKICNNNLNETRKSLSSSEKDNVPEFRVPAEPSSNSNIVFERDKNQSVTSMEDVTNFEIPNQPSSSRKRHRENDNEYSVNTKQKKQSYSKDTPSEVCTDQHRDKDKTETVWKDYFFRPMSEKMKAFYNESRGQENFNIQDIQSKMSKDPRLWTILDEDLMPNFAKRKRFWNVKCNNCNEAGHQTYNCSLPRKPPRCYMCGTQGHTETRCPQKMCLTCGKKQGTFRKTCEFCRTLYCDMCRAIGHKSTECPDHWRRFHQTTQNSEIHIPENLSEVMKPADLLYCCNCTRRGHDSSTCHDYRWSQHFPTPAFVTNYTEGPQCEKRGNTASEDIIPLSKRKAKKRSKTRDVIIREGLGDFQYSSILYSYGSFQTSKHDGHILYKELDGDLYFETDNFLKNDFPPLFLKELTEVVLFDLIIYRTDNKALFIRIRAVTGVSLYIYQLFIYWLKLNDEDKRLLKVYINIPRNEKKILNIFYTKWAEMSQIADDPNILINQIKSLKSSLPGISDPSMLHTTNDRILRLRSKLLSIYLASSSQWIDTLQSITKKMKRCVAMKDSLTDQLYVRCIYLYNEIHLPRTLTSKEMQAASKAYNIRCKSVNVTSKRRKNKIDPYVFFLRSFQKNITPKSQKKEENRYPKRNSAISSNIIQEQNKNVPNCAHTETITQKQRKKIPAVVTTGNITQEQNKELPACTPTGNVIQEQSKKIPIWTSTENVIQEQSKKIPIWTSTENVIQEQSKKIPIWTSTENVIQEQSKKIPIWTSTENVIQEQSKKIPIWTSTENVIQEQSKKIPIWTYTGNVTQEQNKKVPTCTSTKNVIQEGNKGVIPIWTTTETISATVNVQRNDNVTRTIIGVPSGRCYVGESSNIVPESMAVYPVKTAQLPRNNYTSTNDKVENTINQIQERIPQPNSSKYNISTTLYQPGNNQTKRTLYTLAESNDNNSEENKETVKNNNAPATSSSQQEDAVTSDTTTLKKKKKKKKKASENNTEVAKNEGASTDVSTENKAEIVINEALEFNLPYMNKAVEEVKKRINDRNIKQEHIDVLQRLINLERDHRQYVSSFCNYLQ
ncbi:uncharacterized protein LOC143356793 isoform X2 [Halictus rubicundus]